MPTTRTMVRTSLSNIRPGQWVFMALQALSALLALYFWLHTPVPGYSVGCLAITAALMSLHERMHPAHKAVWILIMGVLLVLEFRAIDKDRQDNQKQQARIRAQEACNFKTIMDQGKDNLSAILKQQDDSFRATIAMLIAAQRQDRAQFRTLLTTTTGAVWSRAETCGIS